jgi:replication factor C subunit 2/4
MTTLQLELTFSCLLQVEYSDEGLSALIFTCEGDMRQAINNLQSTHSGFNFVSPENVFKVCDQPHPVVVQAMIKHCQKGEVDKALDRLRELWDQGYSAVDIVVTVFRVVRTFDEWVSSAMDAWLRVAGDENWLPLQFIARVLETGLHQGT